MAPKSIDLRFRKKNIYLNFEKKKKLYKIPALIDDYKFIL